MGLSTAGIAFRSTASTPKEEQMIQQAFGERFRLLPDAEAKGSLDVRASGNIAVETKDGVVFIYNGDIEKSVLFEGKPVESAFLSALGNPKELLVFCHYDSGDSYGYAIIEHGVQVRFRLHTETAVSDEGAPKEFELPWLQAEPFVEEEGELPVYKNTATDEIASKGGVTANLLVTAMRHLFGMCPWDEWSYKSKFNYYRDERLIASSESVAQKPWWKVW